MCRIGYIEGGEDNHEKKSKVSLGCPCLKHAIAWTLPLLHIINPAYNKHVFTCWEEISSADAALVHMQV